MKVLLTGAFGNIGKATITALLDQQHTVRCFDLPTPQTKKAAKQFEGQVEIIWGDLRNADDVKKAVAGVEAVIHIAFIIPPPSELNPDMARAVNVEGTRHLITAMQNQPQSPRLVFASSFHIHPYIHDRPTPITVDAPIEAIDHYGSHKIECEEMIRASGLQWTILRLGSVPPIPPYKANRTSIEYMFRVPLQTRVEFIHFRDAGLAFANAVTCDACLGKVMFLGGGKACQLDYRRYFNTYLSAFGLNMFPDEAFGSTPYCGDWLDTSESQALLQYQRLTFDDWERELRQGTRLQRWFTRLFHPFIWRAMLKLSPYYD
ncbi:MAG: NAD(P)-dependent oxidoreductase [Chloroflexi bacterium]|nr:MAG: NAD(P)-dependent oxidoreductase [Chloroflexota bacterium]